MEKPQILFIHGFRGNHLGIEETMNYLKSLGFECFAPDIPPAFNTLKKARPKLKSFDADGYSKWVADYILENKLDHPILIGHSMGSIICAATAEKYPELISEKIFFLAPICEKPPRFIRSLAPLVSFMPNKFTSYLVTKYLIVPKEKETLKDVLKITYKCAEKFTSKKDMGRAAKFSITYAISDFDFKKDCFFIAGEKDRLNSKKQVKNVAKKFEGHVDFIKKSGHLLNYECPITVAEKIYRLIDPLN